MKSFPYDDSHVSTYLCLQTVRDCDSLDDNCIYYQSFCRNSKLAKSTVLCLSLMKHQIKYSCNVIMYLSYRLFAYIFQYSLYITVPENPVSTYDMPERGKPDGRRTRTVKKLH